MGATFLFWRRCFRPHGGLLQFEHHVVVTASVADLIWRMNGGALITAVRYGPCRDCSTEMTFSRFVSLALSKTSRW
jgi:hypothetical protein